jgi:hypothetical protein
MMDRMLPDHDSRGSSPLDQPLSPTYVKVMLVEAIVIALLWAFARAYS